MIYSQYGLLDDKLRPLPEEKVEEFSHDTNWREAQYVEEEEAFEETFYQPKDNFFISIIPSKYYQLLRKMGETNISISNWMKKQILTALMFGIVCILLGTFMMQLFYVFTPFVVGFVIFQSYRTVQNGYNQWRFERKIAFNKFVRLIIPYLKQTHQNVSVLSIFQRIAPRLDDKEDQDLVRVLIREMGDNPSSPRPFMNFSKRMANTNLSDNFMSALYDIRMGSKDLTGIYALGKMSSDEFMESVDKIIATKIQKFFFFPTKFTMMNIVIILGFAIAIAVYQLTALFSGAGI